MTYLDLFKNRTLAWLAALLLGAALLAAPSAVVRAADWPANSYVLQVDGLACPYCGYGVEKQFSKQDGVTGTDIQLEAGVVVVSVTDGTRFSDEELEDIVDRAGFALGGIRHRPDDGGEGS